MSAPAWVGRPSAAKASLATRGGGRPATRGGATGSPFALLDAAYGDALPDHARPTVSGALRVGAVWLTLWLVPVASVLLACGASSTFGRIAVFFSQMAVVTFGGAYAVLAYVAQQAVEGYGWLRPGGAWRKPRPARSSWCWSS